MRYKLRIILHAIFLCFTYNAQLHSLDEYSSQTFMFTRPAFNSIAINQAGWHDFGYDYKKFGSSLQIYAIYTDTINNITGPEYFLLDNLKYLTMRGGQNPSKFNLTPQGYMPDNPQQDDITTESLNRNILGQWVDYNTISDAKFTLQPLQKQASGVFEYHQELRKLFNSSMFDLWYFSLQAPVTWIENKLEFLGDAIALEKFSNRNFSHAKFPTCKKSDIRLSNIRFLLGTEYLNKTDLKIVTGMGVSFPTAEAAGTGCLFEPVHGFNNHFTLVAHGIFQFPILKKENGNSSICYFLEFENNFLARTHQNRVFDLKDKPYSRYMKLLDAKTNTTIPAMNVTTVRSRVEPFNIFDMATGLRAQYPCGTIEIGYSLWAHGSEEITLDPEHPSDWEDNRYGIAFINEDGNLAKIDSMGNVVALSAGEAGQTSSKSTINHVAAPDGTTDCCPDPTFTQKNKYIRLQDLDTNSAASRSAIVHRAYLTWSFGQKCTTRAFFANLGGYIEASQNNAALSMWGVWGKVGISF